MEVTILCDEPPTTDEYAFNESPQAKAILYVPQGKKEVYAVADVWKDFGRIMEVGSEPLLEGDANDDKVVDVADITAIASKILGNEPEQFNEDNADANSDGVIDVADITATAGIILGPTREAVDLGLPSGLKWASCNIGANKPEDSGNYYAWGDIETSYSYDYKAYKWGTGMVCMTKYTTDGYYAETVDNKTVLEPEDDVAHILWGGNWRMPTEAEYNELIENCNMEWTLVNNVEGLKVSSKTNDNYIFLPAAGYRQGTFSGSYSSGWYWTSSLRDDENCYRAKDFYFYSSSQRIEDCERWNGLTVRAVCKD